MKKGRSSKKNDDGMRPEYRFDYRQANPNRFAKGVKGGRRGVLLDPDVATVFPSAESVNKALRALIAAMPKSMKR